MKFVLHLRIPSEEKYVLCNHNATKFSFYRVAYVRSWQF